MGEFVAPEYGELVRRVDGDRFAAVVPLTYGRARIVVGEVGSSFLLDGW